MKVLLHVLAVLAMTIGGAAHAVDVDEQTRRCNIEKNSLTNPKRKEGAECLKLRAMLGMPEPPVVNNYYNNSGGNQRGGGTQRVFDTNTGRWCTVFPGGTMQCD
ncbi:hypothetical protein [Fontimonas thermophila]|uniref:hypothetical protein n=1 Tax=Fontimonas thermophila TaxID=1076937 RepID=UPI001179BD87|nr:hypothetical protein [Fontimonas thermophila]